MLLKTVGACLCSVAGFLCHAEVFDGEFARLEIDGGGKVASLRDMSSGRELCGSATPVMTAVLDSMRRGAAISFRPLGEGRYEVGFDGISGAVTLEIEKFDGGWTFRVVDASIEQLHALVFFSLKPVCAKYVGTRINGVSDDESGVVLRAYRTDGRYGYPGSSLSITYLSSKPLAGAAVGLAAGRRGAIPEMMRAMTVAAGVPHSDSGGGWSLDSEMNRLSYLIADSAAVDTMDDLLEIAERTGVKRFHFRRFWDQYGWYGIDTNKYPRGLADLKACSEKAKAAGLKTSIHNLSGCIGPGAPWVPTDMADGIRVCHRYTLAEPIAAEGEISEIRVNERPEKDHGYNFATWSRGNTIRIGTELFQYSDISFSPPYAFKNVKRARFGSKAAAHPAGANADYLWCFYGAFLVEPGTPLALASAKRYAEIYKSGDFDGIYNDGLDGYRSPLDCTRFMFDFYSACAATGKPPHFEDSMWTTGGWWFHSMVGSWDYAVRSPKTFVDRHIEKNLVAHRLANFQQMTLGWWSVVVGSDMSFGYMRDDVEYFGAKIAGHDCGFSLIPNYYRGHVQNYAMVGQQVVLGWYERLRVARAFRQRHLDAFREKGADFRLAQDSDGVWRVRRTHVAKHHMVSPADRSWSVRSPAALPAALRVRVLDSGAAWDGKNTLTVLSSSMATNLAVRSEKGVSASVAAGRGEFGGTLRFTATNNGADEDGSWAVAERTIPRPYLNLWTGNVGANGTPLAIGAWVKGDGSGVDVNLQLHSPRDVNDARGDHHVKLDFTGWRYFVFSIWRDHLPEFTERYRWPYMSGPAYSLYERSVSCRSVENVSIWMNGLKAGQTATVEVSDVRVMPERRYTADAAAVVLNGVRHEIPFKVASGQFAELEDGFWTLYSLGGVPLNRARAARAPQLDKGENAVAFECAAPALRAQVTVTALEPAEDALVPDLGDSALKEMSVESEYPRFYSPGRNMRQLAPLAVRPGERAKVAFTLIGPVSRPRIAVGGETVLVDRVVGKNELVRGEFGGTFSGSVPVSMECGDPSAAAATLVLVKRYQPATEAPVVVETKAFKLVIGPDATARSLVVKATGEEMLEPREGIPVFATTQTRPFNNEIRLVQQSKRTTYPANRVRREGDLIYVGFETAPYEVAVRVEETAAGYATFRPERLISDTEQEHQYWHWNMDVPPVDSFRVLQLPVKNRENFGDWLNVMWDGRGCVGVMGGTPYMDVDNERRWGFRRLTVEALKDFGVTNGVAVLAAAATPAEFLDQVDAAEAAAGMPRGVRSRRDGRLNASLYWTDDIRPENLDEHISYAKAGGFRMMLIYYPALVNGGRLGYRTLPDYSWGNGWSRESFAAAVRKLNTAGITVGFHTLQTFIGFDSKYVTPEADHRLALVKHYTLARPLPASEEPCDVYVEQNPVAAPMHPKCRILKFGTELMEYTGYVTERPYRFTGVKRRHLGTYAKDHPLGEIGGVLGVSECAAISSYVDQDTSLQDEIGDMIADIYDCGVEFLYFDGSEDANPPCTVNISLSQIRCAERCAARSGRPPLFTEGCAKSHFGWHLQSGANAFDVFAPEIFKRKIIEYPYAAAIRLAKDFTRVDFGWWRFGTPKLNGEPPRKEGLWSGRSRTVGVQPDIWEYGTSKAAAFDCPATMQMKLLSLRRHRRTADILETVRRWEDVRARKWLTPEQKEMLKDPDREFHLYLPRTTGPEAADYELLEWTQLDVAGGKWTPVRAFMFERGGKRVVAYWHVYDRARLVFPRPLGGTAFLDAAGMRYFETALPAEAVRAAFADAKIQGDSVVRIGS